MTDSKIPKNITKILQNDLEIIIKETDFPTKNCRSLKLNQICDYKSHSRFAVVRFCNHAFDFRPNCTPLSAITIIDQVITNFLIVVTCTASMKIL